LVTRALNERHNVRNPFIVCHRPVFLLALLPCALTGCAREGEPKAPGEVRVVNEVGREDDRTANSDTPMATQPKHGFKEYVKDPDLFRKEVREKGSADSAPPPTAQDLADLVAAIGRRRLEYEELQKLKRAGEKAVPALQSALRNEKFLLHRYGNDALAGSTLETALDLLEPFGLPEASALEPVLRHPDEFYRYHALYHLARCGNDDAIPALKAGIASTSEQCRTWTLMGLEFLKRSSRGSAKFRAELFDRAVSLLADKEHGPAEHAPRALLALDPDRARRLLLGAEILRPENKSLDKVLHALKDSNVSVPAAQLRALLSGIKKKATDHPFDGAYAEALVMLARSEGAKAKDLIDDARGWGNDRVREGAAQASMIAAGVTDAYGFVTDLYHRKGIKGLTESQLYYLTLSSLDAEVRNGGLSQYYFNSSGELAAHAVKAARGVGATELAAIIREANALFGKDGPDADRDQRMDQLSKINLETLERLDTRYYKCSEKLDELLPRFVAAHPEAFRPAR